jgi:hypothetical protein
MPSYPARPTPASLRALLLALLFVASAGVVSPVGQAAVPQPNLVATLRVDPVGAGTDLTAGEPARISVTVSNQGHADAGPFEVDVWCSDAAWGRHSLQVPSLAAGANATLVDPAPYSPALAESVTFHAEVDPAQRVAEDSEIDNSATLSATFGIPAGQFEIVAVPGRLAGNATLVPYSALVLVLDVAQGESILFQAEAPGPHPFDQYLFDEENWGAYQNATQDRNLTVAFFHDYVQTNTEHAAFTTAPLPAGRYYLVVENDERLQHGAPPTGPVNVTYAVATLNNALPPALLAVIVGAAAAAIWATIKWRPAFEVHSPLLEVPPPDPADLESEEDEVDGDEREAGEIEGEGATTSTEPSP